LSDFNLSSRYSRARIDMTPLEHVRVILNLCRERHIEVILIIDPGHVDEQEMFDLAGKWPVLEDWKRKLTKLAADFANSGMHIELWDFYGYDSYSTESVPPGGQPLRWFINPEHYTHALGDIVLSRIFAGTDGTFGVRLTPENIESRLKEVRAMQTAYRATQRPGAERIRNIYTLATATHSD
jgi:hypothetical protein